MDGAEEALEAAIDYARKHEMELQHVFDVCEFQYTMKRYLRKGTEKE